MAYVLVQWVSGKDAGAFSVLEAGCVRGHEQLSFDEDGMVPAAEKSVVVEWRAGKKQKHGWPVFQATLMRASDSKSVLEEEIDRRHTEPEPSAECSKRIPILSKRLLDVTTKDSKQKKKKVDKTERLAAKDSAAADLIAKIRKDETSSEKRQLQQRIKDLEAENCHLKSLVVKEVPNMIMMIKSLIDSTASSSEPVAGTSTSSDVAPSMGDHADKVEIFPNSGVTCDRLSWSKAKHCVTASQLARTLLLGVFDTQTLLESNLKGGINKRNSGAEPKKALDRDCLEAIYSAVNKRFPAVPNPAIGVAISQKLTELRAASDKKQ